MYNSLFGLQVQMDCKIARRTHGQLSKGAFASESTSPAFFLFSKRWTTWESKYPAYPPTVVIPQMITMASRLMRGNKKKAIALPSPDQSFMFANAGSGVAL
mmetsp:Transcript_4754/g.17070  ORF Transcript_4754/g.17070 Transcript_4754/m.17070 type:complete len:101 (-) Transcript_4754:1199-1501(-)